MHRLHRLLIVPLLIAAVAYAEPPRDIPELVEDAYDALIAAEAYLPNGGTEFDALITSAVSDVETALDFDYFCCTATRKIPCLGSTADDILDHMQWCANMVLNSYPNSTAFEKNCLYTIVEMEDDLYAAMVRPR